MPPLAGSEYCWAHDPARTAERRAAQRQGGRTRTGRKAAEGEAEPVPLRSVEEIRGLIEQAAGDVLTLEPSIARARTLGYLASTAAGLLETADLEARLEALEARQTAGGPRRA